MIEAKWMTRLFGRWVRVFRHFWVAVTFVCYFKCPSLSVEQYIRFGHPDPTVAAKKEAQYEAYDRWAPRLIVLANGSLGVALLGVVLFFRRGCIVFTLAAGIVLMCQMALVDKTWIAP